MKHEMGWHANIYNRKKKKKCPAPRTSTAIYNMQWYINYSTRVREQSEMYTQSRKSNNQTLSGTHRFARRSRLVHTARRTAGRYRRPSVYFGTRRGPPSHPSARLTTHARKRARTRPVYFTRACAPAHKHSVAHTHTRTHTHRTKYTPARTLGVQSYS